MTELEFGLYFSLIKRLNYLTIHWIFLSLLGVVEDLSSSFICLIAILRHSKFWASKSHPLSLLKLSSALSLKTRYTIDLSFFSYALKNCSKYLSVLSISSLPGILLIKNEKMAICRLIFLIWSSLKKSIAVSSSLFCWISTLMTSLWR